jgi:hypothetical protein
LNKEESMPDKLLTGWKVKTGSVIFAFGGALYAASRVIPNPNWVPWCEFISILLTGFGGSLLGIGMGHKIDKIK